MRDKFDNFVEIVPNFIKNDFGRKTISFFLAIVLYFSIAYHFNKRAEAQKISGISVELVLPPKMVNLNPTMPPLTVVASGNARALNLLTPRDFRVKIKIPQKIVDYPYILKLSKSDIKTPRGIVIESVEPIEIPLYIEQLITRKIPIEVKVDNLDRLSQDYGIKNISATPSEVEVTGPESYVKRLQTVQTQPIIVDSTISGDLKYSAILTPPSGVTFSALRTQVDIEIDRQYTTKVFKSLPLRVLTQPEQNKLFAADIPNITVDVVVAGPKKRLRLLDNVNITAFLDLSNFLTPGEYQVSPRCQIIGDDTELVIQQIKPEKITVKMQSMGKIKK